jgi:hypothetical protein
MESRSQAQTEAWLRAACADADRRGLPQLKPLLETLARSTAALREAERAVHDADRVAGADGAEDAGPPAPGETTE